MVTKKKAAAHRQVMEEMLRELSPLPRRMSLTAAVRLLFTRNAEFLSWLFACLGMFALCATWGNTHMADAALETAWRGAGYATLVSSTPVSGFKDKFRHVFEITQEGGETRTGTCFSEKSLEDRVGWEFPAEYCAQYDVYRLQGTSVGLDGDVGTAVAIGLTTLAIAVFGLSRMMMGFYRGVRAMRFLKYGEAAIGMKRKVRVRNPKTGRRKSVLVYEYETPEGGKIRQELAEDAMPELPREAEDILFYEKRSPERYFRLVQWITLGISPDTRRGEFHCVEPADFWKTWLAFAFYVLLAGVFVYILSFFWGAWSFV